MLDEEPVGVRLAAGAQVGSFQVIRLLGRGGMGEVYLARDTRLGRKVALKLVSPGLLEAPGAAERFLVEARATATFNNPHIVTIYEVGEHEGVPWVALEYLEGQSLAERLAEEQPSLAWSLRLALAVAHALEDAHRHDILHCDLKPANILVPRDGRPRIVDFGLARILRAEPPSIALERRGTPRYMAPEQWRGGPLTPAVDVWGLGVVLYELAWGRHPYDGLAPLEIEAAVTSAEAVPRPPIARTVPAALGELIDRCLAKRPADRPAAHEVVADLEALLAASRAPPPAEESPFRGLLPFTERHADFFCGRDAEIATFLERMREEPVLPIVGPSGSGKSSFVQAGLVPRLREQGAWTVLALRPGARPFRALAHRLLAGEETGAGPTDELMLPAEPSAAEPRDETSALARLAGDLAQTPARLAVHLRRIAEDARVRLLLFVDQLEELYTLVPDEDVRDRFMRAICQAAGDRAEPVRVCFTLRDDFLGRLAGAADTREALSRLTVLAAPGPEALAATLTAPLAASGYAWDDAQLVHEMVDAVRGEPAALSLLQSTTRLLWDRRDQRKRLLRRADYEAIGGVAGALAAHADGVLAGLSPADVHVARRLLLRLVTPDGMRRVLPVGRVVEGIAGESVVARLVEARLLSVRKADGEHAEAELELVHESLVRSWRTLARWVDEGREELSFLAEVGQAAELWEKRGRRADEVWRGPALAEAQRAVRRMAPTLPARATEFLAAGERAERRAIRRRRALTVVAAATLALVAVGSVVSALVIADKERLARKAAAEAERRGAEAQREAARAAFLRGDTVEARAKLRSSLEIEDSLLARALWASLADDPLLWRRDLGATIYAVAVSRAGLMAVGAGDQAIHLYDAGTFLPGPILRGLRDQVGAVRFSPDGRTLAAGAWSGAIGLWDVATGEQRVVRGHEAEVFGLDFTPDGGRLVSSSLDGTIRIFRVRGLELTEERVLRGHQGGVNRAVVAGALIASSGLDGTVRLWDLETGQQRAVLNGHQAAVEGLALAPDGKLLVSVSADRTARLWELPSGAPRGVLVGHEDAVSGVAVSPDGRLVATGSHDKTVRLWRLDGERTALVATLRHGDQIPGLAFTADGRLLSGGYDRSVRLWRTDGRRGRGPRGHAGVVNGAAFSPDGKMLATAGYDHTVRLWDTATGDELEVLAGHTRRVYDVDFSPDGRLLASAGGEGILLWPIGGGGETSRALVGHRLPVYDVTFSPDGKRLVSASSDTDVRVWDVASGTTEKVFSGHTDRVYEAKFSMDGASVISSSLDTTIRRWPLDGRPAAIFAGHTDAVLGLAPSPDGTTLASASQDGTVRLWDLRTGKGRVLGEHHARVYAVAFHPDGRRVGAIGSDGRAHIWALDGGAHREVAAHHAEGNDLVFSRDGARFATVSDDASVRLWDTATLRPVWRAPLLEPQALELCSQRGWQRFSTRPPRPGTAWRRAVDDDGRLGAIAGDTLCLATENDRLQVWDLAGDRKINEVALAVDDVAAGAAGCVALAGGDAHLVDAAGARTLAIGATAVAASGAEVLVAAGDEVLAISGDRRATQHVGPGVTAILRRGDRLVVGFEDGDIATAGEVTGFSFEGLPASAVTRLVAGPEGTILAGFADGTVGLWSPETGTRLEQRRLHGAITHLHVDGETAIAATLVGDVEVIDLRAYHLPYCELLRAVWDQVSAVWIDGRPVITGRPTDHRCARGGVRSSD